MEAETLGALDAFTSAIRTADSQRQYLNRLGYFFDYLQLPGTTIEEQAASFLNKARENKQWTYSCIIRFVDHYKQKIANKELSSATLTSYFNAIKFFYEMNDLELNWKRIRRGLPKAKSSANDRAPSIEEIRKLVDYPDRRIKAIVYVMCSGGIRIGAWEFLKWKHIIPIQNEQQQAAGQIIAAAKMIVYADEPEQYYTFITPEAYSALKEWIDFRQLHGEKITGESWLMRDLWQTTNVVYGAKRALATNPKQLSVAAIKKLLNRAIWEQNLRQPLQKGIRRHEWKTTHSYRKFFKSRAEQIMKPLNVELLMGHSSGVSDSYWRPTEKEVLQDYLKAVDLLRINTNNKASTLLQKQVAELTEKSEEQNYIIREKLAKKEKEIEEMKAQMTILHANTSNLFKVFMGQTNDLVVYAWNKDEGPTETARAIEAYKKQLQKEKTQQT